MPSRSGIASPEKGVRDPEAPSEHGMLIGQWITEHQECLRFFQFVANRYEEAITTVIPTFSCSNFY